MINCCFAETFTARAEAADAGVLCVNRSPQQNKTTASLYIFLDMAFSITKKDHFVYLSATHLRESGRDKVRVADLNDYEAFSISRSSQSKIGNALVLRTSNVCVRDFK